MRAPRIVRRKGRANLRRGVFLIPSLFTVANTFCGFFSAVESSRGRMERAAVFILVAIVADILDGRIARMTGASSSFGEVFDSLALRGSADARTMASGVSHAMICTLTGLAVSITGLYPVHYF